MHLLDPSHFEAWLAHFRGDPESDSHLDAKLPGGASNLLQMRIVGTQFMLCLTLERQTVQLAMECDVQDIYGFPDGSIF